MVEGFSVIICTYNGADRISEVLDHLAALDTDLPSEILVIDNASTDGVADRATRHWENKSSGGDLRVIREAAIGKTFALRTGFREARYSYLLVCDDDNLLAPDYLKKAQMILREAPEIGLLGGMGAPPAQVTLPPWFEVYQSWYAVGPQHKIEGDITRHKGYVYGAGAIIRKSAWEQIEAAGVELLLNCRRDSRLLGGEDNEIGYLLCALGYKVYWSRALSFVHVLSDERLTLGYLKRIRVGAAHTFMTLLAYKKELPLPVSDVDKKGYLGICWGLIWRMVRLMRKQPRTEIAKTRKELDLHFLRSRLWEMLLRYGSNKRKMHIARSTIRTLKP